jgi:hypothetical protein
VNARVYLHRRGGPVAFDQVAHTAPRVARFIAHLGEQIPIWIACRSDQPHEIGHTWPAQYKFQRVEILSLTALETRALVAEEAVAQGNIQADASGHAHELHRMSGGIRELWRSCSWSSSRASTGSTAHSAWIFSISTGAFMESISP